MTGPLHRELGWWADGRRWFNRDVPTRVVLLVVWAVAVDLRSLEFACVSKRVAA